MSEVGRTGQRESPHSVGVLTEFKQSLRLGCDQMGYGGDKIKNVQKYEAEGQPALRLWHYYRRFAGADRCVYFFHV